MTAPLHIALYEPDIPQNTGAVLRTAACLGVPAHIIEPCGFVMTDVRLKRAGMDYLDRLDMTRHASWAAFMAARPGDRLVLLTTKGAANLPGFAFRPGDMLLFGRESAGVPDAVHAAADARLRIPMAPGTRSLNLAASAAMVLALALDRLGAWPQGQLSE